MDEAPLLTITGHTSWIQSVIFLSENVLCILDNENVHIADGAFNGLVCFCTNQAASILDSSKPGYVHLENLDFDVLENFLTDKQTQGFAPALQSLKIITNQIKALSVHDSAKKPYESLARQ